MITRIHELVPGFDCIAKPCGRGGCGERPGASHGIHCDEWIYGINDGQVAVALRVFSGIYPKSVAQNRTRLDGTCVQVDGHTAFRIEGQGPSDDLECCWLAAGRCYPQRFSLSGADDIYRSFQPLEQFEQPAEFWARLESWWQDQAAAWQRLRVWVA